MRKRESPGFNTPFERLKKAARAAPVIPAGRQSGPVTAAPAAATPRVAAPAPGAVRPATAHPGKSAEADDQRFFEQAMRGATPLADAQRGKRASPLAGAAPAPRRRAPTRAAAARNDDADAEAELADLISDGAGSAAGGRAPDVDRRLLRRLRQGDYPIEADLDLHGRTREEAEQRLERFVALSQDQGRRCVRVIHGRGLNSGDQGPVVRDTVQRALTSGRGARAVLAFTFASPPQGGDGATLVLLRKKK
ncbi:MAG TPA: Smr/MutS family protein [Polyangia bacterium]|nr:Smr/MutS family protein [Polyangia bacterium]